MLGTLSRALARPSIVLCAVAVTLLLPATALGHAELSRSRPEDGATVEGAPDEIVGRFTQDIDPDGSSMLLRDPSGATIAEGALDPENDRRMVISPVPELAPGEYTVRWTTNSAEDGEIARGTWSFTVVAAPSPSASAVPTASPTPDATAGASVEPSPSAVASSEPSPTAAASPEPSPSPEPDSTAGGGDVVLPIIAGLAIVAVTAGFLLTRRGRGTPPA
jgi:methionine-rich copper-binding protein CopC